MNLASIIESHPTDDVALSSRGDTVTYGELRDRAGSIRAGLAEGGLVPGDRVALVCANNRYFVESYLGALGGGFVVVPLNPQSPAPELEEQIRTVGARAVIAGPTAGTAVAQLDRGRFGDLDLVVAVRPDDVAGATPWSDLLDAEPLAFVDRSPEDLALLMFTSGTAGAPRAAMLTHRNLLANIEQMQAVEAIARRRDDVTLGVLPLFHIFGLNVVLNPALVAGARVVLVERFDPTSLVESITAHQATALTGPPTMWSALAQMPSVPAEAFESVRLAVSGAAKLPVEVTAQLRERFALNVTEGYGLTETSPVVASAAGTGAPVGSVGRPLPGVEVRLVDPVGDDVLVGDEGEVLVRGDNVFGGYWDDPAATAAVLDPDGWLHTGDLAVVDDHGFLSIVDRAKDLIIVSGFNVYPAEVEDVLLQHPAIADAAVVGVPHPHTGEAVKAFVVVRSGAEVEEDDIVSFVGGRLARYKAPSKVTFTAEIPKGLGGKVLRRTLV